MKAVTRADYSAFNSISDTAMRSVGHTTKQPGEALRPASCNGILSGALQASVFFFAADAVCRFWLGG